MEFGHKMGITLQILTILFGVGAIWIVGQKKSWNRWGYVVGLISQFFWTVLFIHFNQYFMLIAVVCYTYAWFSGLKNNWSKK